MAIGTIIMGMYANYPIVGVHAHDDRADRRRDAGGDEHRVVRHARIGQDVRVDEDDVRHGEERRQAGQHLGADVGLVFLELEDAREPGHAGGLLP
jgi:hypothetical protein